jgi:thioredoxin reductase
LAVDNAGEAATVTDKRPDEYDVVVVGAGPAGLSAALNLVRARRSTLVFDSNRPRNSATLHSHGFLTRDGISPLELRSLGRAEVESYPEGDVAAARVDRIEAAENGFVVSSKGLRGSADRTVFARSVVLASGLNELLPSVPSIRVYYGTHLHSCVECDGFEKVDAALALIGESDDLAERALLLSQWSDDLIVFTNGVGAVSEADESLLSSRGIRIERRPIVDVVGERGTMTGVELVDGEVIARTAGFVRPTWVPALDFVEGLNLELDAEGLIVVDSAGRTSLAGAYAAGDTVPPGPQQLIVAAGAGATVASTVNRDLLARFAGAPLPVLAAPSQ